MRLVRRASYGEDLDRIVEHIAEADLSAALDMWDAIERQVERLRDFPRSSRIGRQPETRELVISGTPYIVIYMVADDVVLIRLLHGAQKWPADL